MEKKVKLAAVGDSRVGKTAAFISYTTNKFPVEYQPMRTEYYDVTVDINGEQYSLILFDTADGEEHYAIRSLAYSKANAFMVMFSVVSPASFESVKEKWVPEITGHSPETPFFLVGTQIDLRGDPGTIQKLSKVKQKPVTVEDAEEVARKVGAVKYVEFSARTQKGLKNAFDEAICAAIGPPELPANEEMPLPEMSDEMQQQQQQPEIRRKKYITPYVITKPYVNPVTILEHKQAYEKAIELKLCLDICPVRFNHIGLPRSGKTCFRLRLMGKILNILMGGMEFQPSTDLVEAGGQVFIRNMSSELGTIQSKVWAVIKDFEGEVGMLNQVIYQAVSDVPEKNKTKPGAQPSAESQVRINLIETSSRPKLSIWKKFLSLFDKKVSEKPPSKEDMEEAFAVIGEVMKDGEWDQVKYLLEGLILLINTDMGGQAEFLDLQAALALGPSLCLLYRRLVDDLDSVFETYYTNEDGLSTAKEDSTTTVEDVLFQSLSSIACLGTSFSDDYVPEGHSPAFDKLLRHYQSKVLFVGTHRDLVTQEEFKEKDRRLKQRIKNTEFYGKNIIEFASNDQLMLAVDNMSGTQEEIDEIRKILERIIERSFPKISIPVAWLMLSLCIRKTGARTMSLQECEQLAHKLLINPQELQHALWFLHHYNYGGPPVLP